MYYEDDNYADNTTVNKQIEEIDGIDEALYLDEQAWFNEAFDRYLERLDGVSDEREL